MVLLVVDSQKLITTDKLYNFETFCCNIKRLIHTARQNKIEVIYIRHDDGAGQALTKGTDGYEIYDEFKPMSDEKIFDKTVNSPFKDSGLLSYLNDKCENTVIITGLQTDYCIDASVKCAFEHGFDVIVPAFANTTVDNSFLSGKESYNYYNQFMWNKRYAKCISVDDTIKLMTEKEPLF